MTGERPGRSGAHSSGGVIELGSEWPEKVNKPGRVSMPPMHRKSGRRSEGCAIVAVAPVLAVGAVVALARLVGGRR